MGNTWGRLFRVTTWGESHGGATGAVVDGCPPRLPLSEADIQPDLDRRAPGQSALVSQRKESDTVRILSGVFEGQTLGTPISLVIQNEDMGVETFMLHFHPMLAGLETFATDVMPLLKQADQPAHGVSSTRG